MSATDALATLRACHLFGDFPEPAVEALLAYFELLEGRSGELLYRQGDPGGGLYVVASGSVIATVRDIAGAERLVGRKAAPDSFGELAVLLRGERFVSMRAESDVVLLELSQESFRALKQQNPDLCLLLIMAIVRRFGRVLDDSRDVLHRLVLRQFAGLDVA